MSAFDFAATPFHSPLLGASGAPTAAPKSAQTIEMAPAKPLPQELPQEKPASNADGMPDWLNVPADAFALDYSEDIHNSADIPVSSYLPDAVRSPIQHDNSNPDPQVWDEPDQYLKPEPRRVVVAGDEPPYYSGIVRLLDRNDRTAGMTAKFLLTEDLEDRRHPLYKLGKGQRLRTLICTVPDELDDDVPVPVYRGEAIMTWWGDSPDGSWFGLKLDDGPDGEELHPFKPYRADKLLGETFAVALWMLGDDEEVQRQPLAMRKFAPKSPAQQSQTLCKTDPMFQEWAIARGKAIGILPDPDESSAQTAARYVRHACGINSRTEFKTNPLAVEKWNDLHYRFRTWRNLQGKLAGA
jgi:hypothetical protein